MCGNKIANMSSVLKPPSFIPRKRGERESKRRALEDEIPLLDFSHLALPRRSLLADLLSVLREGRDVQGARRVVLGVEREPLSRGEIENVAFDSVCLV